MKKIRYSTNAVFKLELDYENKVIKVNDNVSFGDFVFIFSDYNKFMKYNPPCKECLVCNMCINERPKGTSVYETDTYLYIKRCEILKEFISDNKLFSIREWTTIQ